MAAIQVACQSIWMRKILVGLFGQQMDPTMIYCDNQSCIKLSENLFFHDQSKNIDIRYHHLKDCVLRKTMLLEYVPMEEKDADILTKALSRCKFEFHTNGIKVVDNPFLVEREYCEMATRNSNLNLSLNLNYELKLNYILIATCK